MKAFTFLTCDDVVERGIERLDVPEFVSSQHEIRRNRTGSAGSSRA
jgi:hypothetical protein